jgi:hypothetical protein
MKITFGSWFFTCPSLWNAYQLLHKGSLVHKSPKYYLCTFPLIHEFEPTKHKIKNKKNSKKAHVT